MSDESFWGSLTTNQRDGVIAVVCICTVVLTLGLSIGGGVCLAHFGMARYEEAKARAAETSLGR